MAEKSLASSVFLFLLVCLLSGCVAQRISHPAFTATLTEVATSKRQWTGVAVSRRGRIFVNFPRGTDEWGASVAELLPDGKQRSFPDQIWNPPLGALGQLPPEYFVCVQSLYIDSADFLWVLDSANPRFAGIVKDGPKLVRIDLQSNRVVQVIPFPKSIVLPESYLNDVRVDLHTGTAYITDSGLGALVVTDIVTGTSRRLLESHPSVTSEGITVNIGGEAWRLSDGSIPNVHVDGLAMSETGDFLYYQALTGKTLYRIPTAVLRNVELSEADVESAVKLVGHTCVADGMEFAADGYLYLTDIEHGAIRRLARDGPLELVIQDPHLIWPDSLATGPDGTLYVTTSRIHLNAAQGPFQLFRLTVRPYGS